MAVAARSWQGPTNNARRDRAHCAGPRPRHRRCRRLSARRLLHRWDQRERVRGGPAAGASVIVSFGTPKGRGQRHRRPGAHGWEGRPSATPNTAAICVAKIGETVCGDTAAIVRRPAGTVEVMLADGLGHGPQAAAASGEAARLFRKQAAAGPAAILAPLHAGLRATRGAAVAVASIDPVARQVTYSGIGNIAGFICDTGGVRRMVSHSGTAGHTAGRLQDFRYPLHNRPVLVMFSDGLATSWSPESHPGLFALDPLLIAGVLYRDHARGRDDASVVVWKG